MMKWFAVIVVGLIAPIGIVIWQTPDHVCSPSEQRTINIILRSLEKKGIESPPPAQYPDCADHLVTVDELRAAIAHPSTMELELYLTLAMGCNFLAYLALAVIQGLYKAAQAYWRWHTEKNVRCMA